jgi:hypothetical protein
MSLISIIILLVVFGVLLWAVNTYIPMDVKIKKILNVVVVVLVIVWLLNVFGVWDQVNAVRVSIKSPALSAQRSMIVAPFRAVL